MAGKEEMSVELGQENQAHNASATRRMWGTYHRYPLIYELVVLFWLIVDIGLSASDYSRNAGGNNRYNDDIAVEVACVVWIAPALTLGFVILDLLLYRFGKLHPAYVLTVSTILFCGWAAQVALAYIYTFSETGDWPLRLGVLCIGIFITLTYLIYLVVSASAVHEWRRTRLSTDRVAIKTVNHGTFRVALIVVDVLIVAMVATELGVAYASTTGPNNEQHNARADGAIADVGGTVYLFTLPIVSLILTFLDGVFWLAKKMLVGCTVAIYLVLFIGWAVQASYVKYYAEAIPGSGYTATGAAHVGLTYATMSLAIVGFLIPSSAAIREVRLKRKLPNQPSGTVAPDATAGGS